MQALPPAERSPSFAPSASVECHPHGKQICLTCPSERGIGRTTATLGARGSSRDMRLPIGGKMQMLLRRGILVGSIVIAALPAAAQLNMGLTQRADDGTVYEVIAVDDTNLVGGVDRMRVTSVAGGTNSVLGCTSPPIFSGSSISALVGVNPLAMQTLHAYTSTIRSGIMGPPGGLVVDFDPGHGGRFTIGAGPGRLTVCRDPADCVGAPNVQSTFSLSSSGGSVPAACVHTNVTAACAGATQFTTYGFGLPSAGNPPLCTSTPTINTTTCATEPADGFSLNKGELVVFIYNHDLGMSGFVSGAAGFGIDNDPNPICSGEAGRLITSDALTHSAPPIPPRCGNGALNAGEECDDGNTISGDGCDSNCKTTRCGNGVVTTGEQCDDGNTLNGDGCDNNCTQTACGNGVVSAGEECDDGNVTSDDGCDINCKTTRCGNGVLTSGEQCDDGNLINGDGCDTNCTPTGCGNGVATNSEECDDGNQVDGDGCDSNCTRTACGNGILTPPEQCDDGNQVATDGCTNSCTICGDGVVTAPEECDDGNLINDDGCDNSCQVGLPAGICGDGVVGTAEQCDPGETADPCCVECLFTMATCDDDGKVCTDDLCDGAGVCAHTPVPLEQCPSGYAVLGWPPAANVDGRFGRVGHAGGPVCTDFIRVGRDGSIDGDAIASQISGTAISLGQRIDISADAITGGGTIALPRQTDGLIIGGVRDTSGTRAELSDCDLASTRAATRRAGLIGLAATATMGPITVPVKGSQTINLVAGQNVIDVTGNVLVKTKSTLTLSGVAGTTDVIIRVSGELRLRRDGAVALAGGLTADQVIWVVNGKTVLRKRAYLRGTAFSSDAVFMGWDSKLDGQALSSTAIQVRSQADVNLLPWQDW